ncbi:MAG TPA: CoA pyrophosphatase [Anaerolineae bacterium]|nr:CoA pyrophosphatase [Anaerolineae bacterium]
MGQASLLPADTMERLRSLLAGRPRRACSDPSYRCAAVLVPLLQKEGEWHVLVTQRTNEVQHHRGQISFPGGACDQEDADILATALRETFEEIGVPPEQVQVLGLLDDMWTSSHFAITPVVGVIPYPYSCLLNPAEVEEVIEVPLSFLRDPSNLRIEEVEFEGRQVELLFWDYGKYMIWGATARILKGFLDLEG